jgi:hypothetical protein
MSRFNNYLKLSNCGKYLMILRENYFQSKCCKQFIDIRGVYGRGGEGFRSCVLELCNCHKKIKEEGKIKKLDSFAESSRGQKLNQIGFIEKKNDSKKRWKRCEVADFEYCGNRELLVLMNKGVITRYKFSKLEIAEQITTLELQILPQELAFNLKIDRNYKFACVDVCYQHKSSKSFSTRLFMMKLRRTTDAKLDKKGV